MSLYQGTEKLCPITKGTRLKPKVIEENGTYNAVSDNADGYSVINVSVNPPLQEKTVEENGEVTADNGFYGLSKVNVNVQGGDGNIFSDPYEIYPTKAISDNPSTEQWDTYNAPFINNAEEYDGLSNIKVRKVGAWIDANISSGNIREGTTILGTAGTVVQLNPETVTVKSTTNTQTITPSQGKNAFNVVTVEPLSLQDVTGITPKNYSVTVYKNSLYDGINTVQIDPVTNAVDSNIVPGNIKEGVTILNVVGNYNNYVPPVPPTLEELYIEPNTETQIFTPEEGVDGFNYVSVNAVTNSIDPNITPRNIRRDITILNVTGNYVIENLQNKTAIPSIIPQDIVFDSGLGYDGLNCVHVNAVDSSIDLNITSANIKSGVTILNVTGEYTGDTIRVQDVVNATPNTSSQLIEPDEGYDALSSVNIAAVTSSIDPNILAENIKKNIEILGVTGSFEGETPKYQNEKTVEPSMSGDVVVTPDSTYDALLKVIVKAVTSSIDPNILPKNIKKNVSILGVLGNYEGEEQKWFDLEDLSGYIDINQSTYGEGGLGVSGKTIDDTDYELRTFINDTFDNIHNINAVLFTQVYGYDDEVVTDDVVEQIYIVWVGGYLYQNYSEITYIDTQLRYFYPFENDYAVNGMTIGLDSDDGSSRVMDICVITDSTGSNAPVPVLVNKDTGMILPEGYDGYRYIREITIPAHTIFEPKTTSVNNVNWILKNNSGVITNVIENSDKPESVYVSACDIDYGTTDNETIVTESGIRYKKTSHEIVPEMRDLLFVNRANDRVNLKYNGDETFKYASFNSSEKMLELGKLGYISIPNKFDTNNKTWEILAHFKLNSSNNGTYRHICSWLGGYNSDYNVIWVDTNNRLNARIWYNYSNIIKNGTVDSSVILENDREYYIKMGWNGSNYYIYLSLNSDYSSNVISWNYSSSNSTYSSGNILLFGNMLTNGEKYSIDNLYLDEYTYVKLDNKIVWKSINDELRGNLVDYNDNGSANTLDVYLAVSNIHKKITNADIIGSLNIPSSGIVNNFDSGNLLITNTFGNFDSFEIKSKITTSSNITTNQIYFCDYLHTSACSIALNITSSKFRIYLSTNGTSWDIANAVDGTYTVLVNTTYYIKLVFDGTKYVFSYSLDGETWTDDIIISDSSKVISFTPCIGSWYRGNFGSPFKGSIDLTETYIKINDEIWWQPDLKTTYDYDWIFTNNSSWSYEGLTNFGKKGVVIVPEHSVYEWDQEKMLWRTEKNITLNVDDENTIIYTEIKEL